MGRIKWWVVWVGDFVGVLVGDGEVVVVVCGVLVEVVEDGVGGGVILVVGEVWEVGVRWGGGLGRRWGCGRGIRCR